MISGQAFENQDARKAVNDDGDDADDCDERLIAIVVDPPLCLST